MKICPECNAVFDGKKWNGSARISEKESRDAEQGLCTACKRIRDKVALGTAYLTGDVINSRQNEMIRMIRREEEIERARNHCSRILEICCEGETMTVKTVNSLLAIHIARQCKKAFKGRMEIYKDTPGHRPKNKDSEGTVAVKWVQQL